MPEHKTNVTVTSMVRKTLRDQPVLCVRSSRTNADPGHALALVDQARRHQVLAQAGPPYWFCWEVGEGQVQWEAGVPVNQAGAEEDPVEPSVLPGGEVASVYFRGDYHDPEQAAAVIEHLRAEMAAASLVATGEPRWVYLTDPETTPDPLNHYTEVVWPVGTPVGTPVGN